MTDENTTEPVELDDATLAAAGLQRTTAYVKTGKVKRKPGAERQARKRARDAEKGIVTKALDTTDQEALDMGKKVLSLKGWKKKLVMRWIG